MRPIYHIFLNLIHTNFCGFLIKNKKNKKKKTINRIHTKINIPVSINKPFKDRLRQQYPTWIADPAHELKETGKIKRTAPSEVARWVSAAWKAIPESIIIRSFKKRCISNALDGSEDDILWEDDGEDKDDSDWVTDNDSVMSDDGESDE